MKDRALLAALLPLCLLAAVLALVRLLWCITFNPARGWQLAIAFDQLGNTACNGDPDETISSRAARARLDRRRWGCLLCRLLDALHANHCDQSLERRFLRSGPLTPETA